jgi:DNA-binding NarL/FixJ family response regulator
MEPSRDRRRVTPLRVLLADDHALFLDALELLLGLEGDIEVIGRAADGAEAVDLALALQPDLVLMDLHMPVCDGVEALRRLRLDLPSLPIVMLSSSSAAEDLERAHLAGATSYLSKDAGAAVITAELARHTPPQPPLATRSAA